MAETLQLSERVWYEAVNIVTFNAAAGSSSTTLTVPISINVSNKGATLPRQALDIPYCCPASQPAGTHSCLKDTLAQFH